MIDVKLTVNKANVYNEVAKTTSYTGAKMVGDENAYRRIFAKDDDRLMLERFWTEACSAATEEFKPFITEVSANNNRRDVDLTDDYVVDMELSSAFDENLTGSIEQSLFSFFVLFIVSRWYKFTNKNEAASFAEDAAGMMEDVKRKIYYRKKPKRIPV